MVKYRFSYVTITPESAEVGEYADNGRYSPPGVPGGHFPAGDDTAGGYHEARASEAVRDILRTIGGYLDMVQQHNEQLFVWGDYMTHPATGTEERRTAEVIAPARLLRAMMRKFRESR